MKAVARLPAQASQLGQGWARVCDNGVQRSLLGQETHAEGSAQAPRAHSCSIGAGCGLLLGAHGKQQQGLGSIVIPQVGQEVCGQAPKGSLVVDKALEALQAQHLGETVSRKQYKPQGPSTEGSRRCMREAGNTEQPVPKSVAPGDATGSPAERA